MRSCLWHPDAGILFLGDSAEGAKPREVTISPSDANAKLRQGRGFFGVYSLGFDVESDFEILTKSFAE